MLLFFKVNIVAEYVNAKRMAFIVCFYTEINQTFLNSWYVKTTGVRRGETDIGPPPGNWY